MNHHAVSTEVQHVDIELAAGWKVKAIRARRQQLICTNELSFRTQQQDDIA